jgi:hypothetical protein
MPVSPIECVTAGVSDLAGALAFCRGRLRLEVVSDARASVGLLGAWKRPVHETLRLVELALPGHAPRLRLAEYETPVTGSEAILGLREFVPPRASVVLAADDLDAAARFHTEALGWPSVAAGGVELVEGKHDAGLLAPEHLGFTHLTCSCDDLDEVLTRIEAMSLEPLTRPTHVGLPGGRPGRVMLVRAPGSALYELYEIAA